MCGIVGHVSGNPNREAFRQAVLNIWHRGPDSHGSFEHLFGNKIVQFGHTRLSILDLSSAGHQPMISQDGRWVLTYNGEIYNHLELRTKSAENYRGRTDTESLLEAIARDGIATVLPRLDGMFAFGVLDKLENKVYLARDRFGIKPIYYFAEPQEEEFGFGSEIRSLVAIGARHGAIDENSLQAFLTLRYIPSPLTLHKNIYRLPPGHLLEYDLNKGGISISLFPSKATSRYRGTFSDAVEDYHSLLSSEVERQLMSDVPVGLLLSGGIDSALIGALAKESGHSLSCYTVGMENGGPECELDDAAFTAKTLGLKHCTVRVTPAELWGTLDDVVKSVEEPLGTTSTLLMAPLVRRARQDVKVVLTGQGSDEPWGGYFRYQAELLRRCAPAAMWSLLKFLPMHNLRSESIERGARSLPVNDDLRRFIEEYALFTSKEIKSLTGKNDDGYAAARIKEWFSRAPTLSEPVEQMMFIDARMNLSDDLLLYADKISMSTSLETRVPMLGNRIVDFVESLPRSFRLRLGQTKIVHKAMAKRFLPSAIVQRKKKGFLLPFGDWSRGVWRDRIAERIFDSRITGILAKSEIENIWNEHLTEKRDQSRKIFALTMLSSYLVDVESKQFQ